MIVNELEYCWDNRDRDEYPGASSSDDGICSDGMEGREKKERCLNLNQRKLFSSCAEDKRELLNELKRKTFPNWDSDLINSTVARIRFCATEPNHWEAAEGKNK